MGVCDAVAVPKLYFWNQSSVPSLAKVVVLIGVGKSGVAGSISHCSALGSKIDLDSKDTATERPSRHERGSIEESIVKILSLKESESRNERKSKFKG